MPLASSIRTQLITDAVQERLEDLAGVTVYRSEVVDQPPRMSDSDRVAPYVVIYPYPGKPYPNDTDLGDTAIDAEYTCQVTCAAGYSRDCEHLVDIVHPQLWGWTPTVANMVVGYFQLPPGYDPGPVRIDRTISPPRFSVPLQYRLIATAT